MCKCMLIDLINAKNVFKSGSFLTTEEECLVPASLGTCNDVLSDVGDLVIAETSAEGRHGVLSISHLGDDGRHLAATREVLVESLLLKGLVGHDNVLSSGMAGGAVGLEDLRSCIDISESRGGDAKCEGASDGTDLAGLWIGDMTLARRKVQLA